MRLFLRCLASAALIGTASAQLPFDGSGTSIEWPTGAWGAGNVTRMLSGDFTGDFYRDLVLLEGDELVLSFGPAVFTWRTHLGTGVVDACVVPNAAGAGFDGLLASDGSGLRKISIDYSQSSVVQDSVLTSTGAWANAHSLQTLMPATGVPTIVGITAGGHHVLRITDPFGSSRSLGTVAELLNNEILDVAVVNWNGIGAPEVAVLYDEGIKVYNGSPTPVTTILFSSLIPSIATPLVGGSLVAFRQDGLPNGRLAAVVEPPGDDPQLCVLDASGYEIDDLSIVVGVTTSVVEDPYALAAGDLDGDHSDEIVVSHQDSSFDGPVVYWNLCTSAGNCNTFDDADAEVLDLGVSWDTYLAKPVLGDFTSDGDLDVAWFQQDDTLVRLAENTTRDHTEQLIDIEQTESEVRYDLLNPELTRSFVATFILPDSVSEFSFTPNTILVEEWYEGDDPLELDSVGVLSFTRSYPTSIQGPVTLDMMLWPIDKLTTGLVHLTIRAVRVDGEIVAAGPAMTFTIGQGSDARDYLFTKSFPTFSLTVRSWNLPEFTGSLAATYMEGPFTSQNATEGSGGGKPPRPPPGLDKQDPPKSPIHN